MVGMTLNDFNGCDCLSCRCNLLEVPDEDDDVITWSDEGISLTFGPFKIITLICYM